MADDTQQRGTPDRTRINVNEDYELRYWSEKFSVSPERLREVVQDVGPMVKDVEKKFQAAGRNAGK